MGAPMIVYSKGILVQSEMSGESHRIGSGLELVYTGLTDHTLHVVYREYNESGSESYARPPFTLSLVYDLRSDSIIVFRDYLIQVVETNSKRVRFVVLKEPAAYSLNQSEFMTRPGDVEAGTFPKLKLKRSKVIMDIRILAEGDESIVYSVVGVNKEGRAHKSEIDFIVMPDGTIRQF
jgi:hypothetical protein